MADELWDLSEPQERVAHAMWRDKARVGTQTSIWRGRTREAFREQDPETRKKWMERAAVAIEALLRPKMEARKDG